MAKRWRIYPHDPDRIAALERAVGIPAVLGQEFSGYAAQVNSAIARIRLAQRELYPLAQGVKFDQAILNKVEMAFRAYDPCFGCATHFAVGQMPLTVKVFDSQKQLVQTLQR